MNKTLNFEEKDYVVVALITKNSVVMRVLFCGMEANNFEKEKNMLKK